MLPLMLVANQKPYFCASHGRNPSACDFTRPQVLALAFESAAEVAAPRLWPQLPRIAALMRDYSIALPYSSYAQARATN